MKLLLLAFVATFTASSQAMAGARVGGYARVMARPDLQGGSGRLGYWNLYGRLLNEGPYANLDFDYDILEPKVDALTPWTTVHMRVEGGSIGGTDAGNGRLDNFRLSQLHILAGNVLLDNVTWQVGTLESTMGDLGLYDMRPAQIFHETVGMSARYQKGKSDLTLGIGDSGYTVRGDRYNPILTAGGSLRVGLGDHVQLGFGGQWMVEPGVEGNVHAPYDTPNLMYEDWIREEVIQSFRANHPIQADRFPDPSPTAADSGHAFGYLGFGDLGPIRWNSTYARWQKFHPDGPSSETWNGETEDIHVTALTDERSMLMIGNEMNVEIVPGKLDMAWGVLYGNHQDGDNDILPSDHDREYASTVLRLQAALNQTLGILTESSLAHEWSRNGNLYREHSDSIFANTNGVADTRGLERGDSDTRITWQGKAGFILNPLGPGITSRPSLRLLYGAQHSNENNAFSNQFVTTLDQYNEFGNVEQHWHHILALEAEAWF